MSAIHDLSAACVDCVTHILVYRTVGAGGRCSGVEYLEGRRHKWVTIAGDSVHRSRVLGWEGSTDSPRAIVILAVGGEHRAPGPVSERRVALVGEDLRELISQFLSGVHRESAHVQAGHAVVAQHFVHMIRIGIVTIRGCLYKIASPCWDDIRISDQQYVNAVAVVLVKILLQVSVDRVSVRGHVVSNARAHIRKVHSQSFALLPQGKLIQFHAIGMRSKD